MRAFRTFPRATLATAVLAVSLAVGACGDDDPMDPDDGNQTSLLVGSWTATSILAAGVEILGPGMVVAITFGSDGMFELGVTGDAGNVFCEDDTACVESGDYTVVGSVLTLNNGEDSTVLDYSVSGIVLTATGTIEGIPAVLTFDRT